MRLGICSGSFDPVTCGHVDIFRRAALLVDELTVCIFVNRRKKALFTIDERLELLRDATGHIPNLRLDTFDGLLADYLKARNIKIILRGLRSAADLEYETCAARMNKYLYPDIETVFLLSAPQYSFVSSTVVKEVASFGGNIDALVPPNVARAIREKFKGKEESVGAVTS